MTKTRNYLAVDLGAESGRAMLGKFEGGRLALQEVHRFSNAPVRVIQKNGAVRLNWDVLRLWSEIKQGISWISKKEKLSLDGIGLDTWGVDFGLFDRNGGLLSNPYYYRDSRTDGLLDEAFKRVTREKIFQTTGIQFMQINSLYQLLSMVISKAPELEIADTLLTMPDIFNFWLTGRQGSEFSIATTTQCYDPTRRTWADDILAGLGIPRHIFKEIIPPGTVLGPVLDAVAEEIGTKAAVIAPACHDTGSAVAAIPAKSERFAWISSGTWSIMGTNVKEPVINDQSLAFNFTNEGGIAETFRFCKNIMGLWLVQECRRTWASTGEEHSYAELTEMAAKASPLTCFVDPDSPDFLHPGDMPGRIRAFCRKTGQKAPEEKGAVVRCALESLALKYRYVLECMETMVGMRLEPIHIVGGGTQNRLLNRFTADATGRTVVTGPIEATAIGNILTQAIALDHIRDSQRVEVLQKSCELNEFIPGNTAPWQEAYDRFLKIQASAV